MLEVSSLTAGYGDREIIRGIDLEVSAGETLAVIGESGTGKTTLGLCLMGLLRERASDAHVSGKILLDGVDVGAMGDDELRAVRWTKISMVFQNTGDALNPVHRVIDQVQEPLLEHEICAGARAAQRAREMLRATGLAEDRFAAYPHQLSTGEKQRVLIAMALVCDPKVVILDEPTSSLDAISRIAVSGVLRDLCRDKVCLVITHDLFAAVGLADRIAVLCGGRIVEEAPSRDVLGDPRHPYSRGLIRCYPDMTRGKDLQGIRGRASLSANGCPFFGRCTQAIDVCAEEPPSLRPMNGRTLACHRGGIVPLLTARKLAKRFGGKEILRDLDLTLFEGETLALVGESGSGKTTLAKCMVGLLSPDAGEIRLESERLEGPDPGAARKMQLIFQDPREAISHRMNVLEAVQEPLDVQGIGGPSERRERVKAALRDAELPDDDDFLHRYPHHLSGGELQRVVIARALVLQPKVLIADEPTSALDPSVQAKVMRLLCTVQESRGLSILLITHDIALARKASDRIAILHEGRVMEAGPTSEILSRPSCAHTRALIGSAPHLREHLERRDQISNESESIAEKGAPG